MSTRRSGRRTERDDDEIEEVVRHRRHQKNHTDDEASQRLRRKQDYSDNNNDGSRKGHIEEDKFHEEEKRNKNHTENEEPVRRHRPRKKYSEEEESEKSIEHDSNNNKKDHNNFQIDQPTAESKPSRQRTQRKEDNISDGESIEINKRSRSRNESTESNEEGITRSRRKQHELENENDILGNTNTPRTRVQRREQSTNEVENNEIVRRPRQRRVLTENEENETRSQNDGKYIITNEKEISESEDTLRRVNRRRRENTKEDKNIEENCSILKTEQNFKPSHDEALILANKKQNLHDDKQKNELDKHDSFSNKFQTQSPKNQDCLSENNKKEDNKNETIYKKDISENKVTDNVKIVQKLPNPVLDQEKNKIVQKSPNPVLDQKSTNPVLDQKSPNPVLDQEKNKIVQKSPNPVLDQKSPNPVLDQKSPNLVLDQEKNKIVQKSPNPVLDQEKNKSETECRNIENNCYSDSNESKAMINTHENRNEQVTDNQQQKIDNISIGCEKTNNEENKKVKSFSDQTKKNVEKLKTSKKIIPSVPEKKITTNKFAPTSSFNNKTKVISKAMEEKQKPLYNASPLENNLPSTPSASTNFSTDISSSEFDSKYISKNEDEVKSENEYTKNVKSETQNNGYFDDVNNLNNQNNSNAHDVTHENLNNSLPNKNSDINDNNISQVETNYQSELNYNEVTSDLHNGHLIDETNSDRMVNDVNFYNNKLKESLTNIKSSYSGSQLIDSLMDTYLNQDYLPGASSVKSHGSKKESGKQPPFVKAKPNVESKNLKEPEQVYVEWPPKEPPQDIGAYIVESYGKTDPYSKKLIKDIQRSKREEEEKREAEKRAEIVSENTQAVSILRSTFSYKPATPKAGVQKPTLAVAEERSWIKHEKKPEEFDSTPSEPDWMTLVRNRRWKSTVRARFPGKSSDKTDFERRSTTPKNWKNLAKDKQALQALSEVVGIGAEGEELLMRLASQRNKIEEKQKELDKQAQEELLAYEVARERLGSDTAYSLQMDNPLPAARMKLNPSYPGVSADSVYGSKESLNSNNYPFTNSQLEAAYLTNKLLRLHPEELKKLISLERSRQATLRWQFSADKFDSVHDHQNFPIDVALLASQEPRLMKTMKMLLSNENKDEYESEYSTRSDSRNRTQSDCTYMGDSDGYESSSSHTSSVASTRSFKKKAPVPPPKKNSENVLNPYTSSLPRRTTQKSSKYQDINDNREVFQHGFLTDEELSMSDEIEKMQEALRRGEKKAYEELRNKTSTPLLGFFEDIAQAQIKPCDFTKEINQEEIASRRQSFIEQDNKSNMDAPEIIPTTRHKVKRINSNAQLNALFRKRRERSESDCENNSSDHQSDEKPSEEMKNLLTNITNTFGQ
ncbi:general transcriptional corepressor trfA isoform X1 [Hydra vulgaris]|uniref:general transcriptional corepressor trfA isoform X1 n=1 Tax=Hydra vulgaris TaxID=6087 RepID=UPI001F5E8054|nr:general transcriptional corepressor trfA isoform X1 [Hydra vulgaris]XP_012554169.2 general transcriptional corepressor trfA isoform X1 [Hydra vulgaris]XP_012554170.2 general transcriptional corepressor trfA isoform X1 [Hydra vulgaris]XP_047122369.1 general transcriptional corepressor trfA isoform X1 [Hydra vulgaris]